MFSDSLRGSSTVLYFARQIKTTIGELNGKSQHHEEAAIFPCSSNPCTIYHKNHHVNTTTVLLKPLRFLLRQSDSSFGLVQARVRLLGNLIGESKYFNI